MKRLVQLTIMPITSSAVRECCVVFEVVDKMLVIVTLL